MRSPRLLLKAGRCREDVVRRHRRVAVGRAEHRVDPRRIAVLVRIAALRGGRTDKNR